VPRTPRPLASAHILGNSSSATLRRTVALSRTRFAASPSRLDCPQKRMILWKLGSNPGTHPASQWPICRLHQVPQQAPHQINKRFPRPGVHHKRTGLHHRHCLQHFQRCSSVAGCSAAAAQRHRPRSAPRGRLVRAAKRRDTFDGLGRAAPFL